MSSLTLQQLLQRRAGFLAAIRQFFAQRGVLEVDTPILASYSATDPFLDSFDLSAAPDTARRYLLTSPEHAMKRLLAGGSGPIYQLGKVFRRGEFGQRHNPEFTLLEWYRPGWSLSDMRQELTDLLQTLGLPSEAREYPYRELFRTYLGIDPLLCDTASLSQAATDAGLTFHSEPETRDDWLDLLMSHLIEPRLPPEGAAFVSGYPASQASLAEVTEDVDGQQLAARFELYINGVEVANAYQELTDAAELARRFAADNARRQALGLPVIPEDTRLLESLGAMPPGAGIAVGFDRLLMLATGSHCLADVMPFAWDAI